MATCVGFWTACMVTPVRDLRDVFVEFWRGQRRSSRIRLNMTGAKESKALEMVEEDLFGYVRKEKWLCSVSLCTVILKVGCGIWLCYEAARSGFRYGCAATLKEPKGIEEKNKTPVGQHTRRLFFSIRSICLMQ